MLLKNKIEIESWLKKYSIKNYELIENEEYGYVVNVNGIVNLWNKHLKSIDVKFNIVEGSFYCSNNNLRSFEGCPEFIKFDFVAGKNELTSLKNCPKTINNAYFFNDNNIDINGLLELPNNLKGFINLEKNKKLGDLQDIKCIEKLKKILTIYKEKTDLMKVLEVTDKSIEKLDLFINNDIINSVVKDKSEKTNKI